MSRLVLFSLLALAGCEREPESLGIDQLTPSELDYVRRYVVLERARAVGLADPALGASLLDSLAAAWGDSADVTARRALPTDPSRAAAVQDLVRRLLEAEADSLVFAPSPRRLAAPLPAPVPPGKPG
ncbi:MAG TPA: hypothetical protein PLL30_05005 [Candidatus Krumholzibacteria bacterium]|nr:hypothetical protein [Candidatus Krumholzibacteria bacterium]HPD71122.1 hypothetical protein [Candidatus Krumholzibacteria bacterium]HRY39178.1 hypothetical protein [Candidatus Krumholzibacteria bacterium]